MHPPCFENQEQFDLWLQADNSCYNYCGKEVDRHTLICTDCTPTYASCMRAAGRCEHPEIKFYRSGRAFRGSDDSPSRKRLMDQDLKWELVNEQDEQE